VLPIGALPVQLQEHAIIEDLLGKYIDLIVLENEPSYNDDLKRVTFEIDETLGKFCR
jgi:hypothetical protein